MSIWKKRNKGRRQALRGRNKSSTQTIAMPPATWVGRESVSEIVKIRSMRVTLYPWTGLLIKSVLVHTHVCCWFIDRRRAVSFLSCTTETETTLVPLWKITPGFPPKIRLQVLQIRSHCQNPGNYRAFNLIQSSIITLAHSDEPYIYAEIWEINGNPDSTN